VISLEDELRASLHQLADQGRPVNLGGPALAGARRRRLINISMTVAAAAVVLALLIPLHLVVSRRHGQPGTGVAGDPSQRHVVSAYTDAINQWWLLDPQTGNYERVSFSVVAVSPDLRAVAKTRHTLGVPGRRYEGLVPWTWIIDIRSTTDNTTARPITTEGWLGRLQWSPDGVWIAAPVADEPGAGGGDPAGFTQVLVANPTTGAQQRVTLRLDGRMATSLAWTGDSRLVVTTAPRDAGLGTPPDRVSLFELDGTMVADVPLDQGDLAPGPPISSGPDSGRIPRWELTDVVHVPEVLLTRPTDSSVQLLRLDLTPSPGPGEVSTLALPGAPAGMRRTLRPAAWVGDDTLLLVSTVDDPSTGRPKDVSIQVADLRTGRSRAIDAVPKGATSVIVSPARGLSAKASRLAF
jgi:hypothetical protein